MLDWPILMEHQDSLGSFATAKQRGSLNAAFTTGRGLREERACWFSDPHRQSSTVTTCWARSLGSAAPHPGSLSLFLVQISVKTDVEDTVGSSKKARISSCARRVRAGNARCVNAPAHPRPPAPRSPRLPCQKIFRRVTKKRKKEIIKIKMAATAVLASWAVVAATVARAVDEAVPASYMVRGRG